MQGVQIGRSGAARSGQIHAPTSEQAVLCARGEPRKSLIVIPSQAEHGLYLRTCCVNNVSRYHGWVLRSFRDKDTEAIWHRRRSRRLDLSLQRVAWRKLAMLDAAERLADLMVPPGTGSRSWRRSCRAVQHPDQPAVADLLPLDRRGARGRGDH